MSGLLRLAMAPQPEYVDFADNARALLWSRPRSARAFRTDCGECTSTDKSTAFRSSKSEPFPRGPRKMRDKDGLLLSRDGRTFAYDIDIETPALYA